MITAYTVDSRYVPHQAATLVVVENYDTVTEAIAEMIKMWPEDATVPVLIYDDTTLAVTLTPLGTASMAAIFPNGMIKTYHNIRYITESGKIVETRWEDHQGRSHYIAH